MTIDEAIVKLNSLIQLNICPNLFNEIIEWLEELKAYQQLDLEIPQHFTKEQSDWIKNYCIQKIKNFIIKELMILNNAYH